MVMPLPWRRKDHVPLFHGYFLPFDSSKTSTPFDDEAERKGAMSVRRCCLPGQNELEACIRRVGSIWWTFTARLAMRYHAYEVG